LQFSSFCTNSQEEEERVRLLKLHFFSFSWAFLHFFLIVSSGLDILKVLPPSKFSVERVSVTLKDLPASASGLKLVQISDIHYQEKMDARTISHLNSAIDTINAETPDIVVITGDLVNYEYTPAVLSGLSNLLGRLKARYGRYVILGNHDYIKGGRDQANLIRNALTSKGLEVLINSSMGISFKQTNCTSSEIADTKINNSQTDADLVVVGLDDLWSGDFNPKKAFQFVNPNLPRIVLSHNPDTAVELSQYRADLILSGHTHAGQICFPSRQKNRGRPILPLLLKIAKQLPHSWQCHLPGSRHWNAVKNWDWAQGLHQIPRTSPINKNVKENFNYLYVNRGLTDIYRRVFCDPEITILTLLSEGKT